MVGNTNAITCCPHLGIVRWELWLAGKYTLHLKGTAIHHTTEWAPRCQKLSLKSLLPSLAELPRILADSLPMALVTFAVSASLASIYADKYSYTIDSNQV